MSQNAALCGNGLRNKGLTITETDLLTNNQTTNFRLFQTERVCRRQFRI